MQNTKRSLCHSIQVSRKPLTAMALALAASVGLTLSFSTQAATITVTSANDAAAPADVCSLRGAVMAVNSGANANGCTATGAYGSDDTIQFAPALTGSTISVTSEIEIQKSLTINGGSANAVTLDANHATNIFYVNGGTKLVIDGMVFKNGKYDGSGSAIFVGQIDRGTEQPELNDHELVIRNSTFSGNSNYQFGGAIAAWAGPSSVTIENSTFNDNTAGTGGGGAVFAHGPISISNSRFFNNKVSGDEAWGGAARGTDITVSDSTFDHNNADMGGALATSLYRLQTTGTVSVSNSTFSNNAANGGGAIAAVNVNIENSTVIGNKASLGGAIYTENTLSATHVTFVSNFSYYNFGATLYFNNNASGTINNSLIASIGYDGEISRPHCVTGSGVTLNGRNNIEWRNGSNDNSCKGANPVLVPNGMSLGQIVSTALADNGGLTQTLALPSGSPAIDAGYPAIVMTADQRGQARPQGSGPDLGAFEVASSSGTATGVDVTTQVVDGVTLTTINGQLVSSPEHVGMNTATFVFVNIAGTDSWLLLNPETGWHPWVDCGSSAFSYSFGAMPWVTDIALFYSGDLSPFHGWPVFFGYGVGNTKEAACADMFNNTRYTHVTTL